MNMEFRMDLYTETCKLRVYAPAVERTSNHHGKRFIRSAVVEQSSHDAVPSVRPVSFPQNRMNTEQNPNKAQFHTCR